LGGTRPLAASGTKAGSGPLAQVQFS